MATNNLVDIFRQLHPNTKRYTWRRKNPIKQARLDYFIGSNRLMDIVQKCSILPGYRSDHSRLEIEILLDTFKKGKGIWRFNSSLLKNSNYVGDVKSWIRDTKTQYALPVYNLENINEVEDANIQFTISDSLFLEMLLLTIRGNSIRFSSKLKKANNNREHELIKEIEKLESKENPDNSELIDLKKDELEQLRDIKLQGFVIRSRVQNIQLNEKPTKFFCNLEKAKYIDKTIKKISLNDGKVINKQGDILLHVKDFYTDLFNQKDILEENCNNLDVLTKDNKISAEDSKKLNGPITIIELSEALKHMKNNKTPGIDGFPAEFFKEFWDDIKMFILRAVNESYYKGILPPSLRQTVISCLPKGNKPRDNIKNWRPISLTSVLYKLTTTVIANRLKKVLPNLISPCQTGFIKGRFIGESTRLVYDLMNYAEKKKITGLLMLIDFEKAFDSISWKFMYTVLEAFNFDQKFIKWIKLFNTEITASILQVGVLSDFFPIKRGCKQGDPIAPYLFILCSQILCEMILKDKDIKGIHVGSEEFKISQFADDTTIFLDGSEGSLQQTLNTLEIFGSLSGLKMNLSKTKMLWIGKKRLCNDKINCGMKLNWDDKQFTLLGIDFDIDLQNIPHINYSKALLKVDESINAWRKRQLTPLGRITVVKSLILSKLNHLFMAIPLPNKDFCQNLGKKLYNFV